MEESLTHNGNASSRGGRNSKGVFKNKIRNLTIVAVILLIGIASFVGWNFYQTSVTAQIDSNKYQAVFLTNGQVYFGKMQRLNGDYYKLTDIFYLQTKSTTNGSNPQQTSTSSTTDVQLIKLGSEIHGPEDTMIMSKEQILFFENLKKDGSVTKTILDYNKKN